MATLAAQHQVPSSRQSDASNDFVEGRLLDGFLLLAAGGSSSPDEVVSVNLSSLQLVDVAGEDLAYFAHLDRLDVSDNQLSYESILQQMGRLPRLSTLVLACNTISSLQVPMGTLRKLQSLDLSFNELHGDVLGQLSRLSNLVTLNLSRNCISSVPPEEELYDFHSLEELILDANDLVQFIQWRALDALPRLRKLSLASNRVKRLKDDAPDTEPDSGELTYFPQLEELNLSGNEIVGVDSLPIVQSFGALRTLILSDNPCSRGQLKDDQKMHGLSVVCQETKPFYLKGSGCHQVRSKKTDPRLKLQRGRMRKVRSSPHVGGVGGYPRRGGNFAGAGSQRPVSQLGVLDTEANELLVNLGDAGRGGYGGDYSSTFLTAGAPIDIAAESPGIFSDELAEEELDQIFRERRAYIEKRFKEEVEEPTSFMRQAPFAIGSAAGRKLELQSRQGQQSQEKEDANATNMPGRHQSFGGGGGDDATDLGATSGTLGGTAVASVVGGGAGAPVGASGATTAAGGGHKISRPNVLSIGGSASAAQLMQREQSGASPKAGRDGADMSPDNTVQLTLPPIRGPSSRVSSANPPSSAGGSVSGDAPVHLPPTAAGVGLMSAGRSRPIADVSVRDAMRALRAAAMSDFATAH